MRRTLACAVVACALNSVARGEMVLDGVRDPSYGPALAVQTVQTGFGDASPNGGSELDVAYARLEGGTLYLLLTGNLEQNFNKLNIFIDSVAGGENQLTNNTGAGGNNPSNDGWAAKHAGFTFDSGFAADYLLILRNGNSGGDQFNIDFSSVGNGGTLQTANDLFGGALSGSNANALPNGIGVAFDRSNIGGVVGGDQAANQVAAAAVTTGIELAIPLAALGNPMGAIKISAMINGSNHDYLSNQFLGGLTAPQVNLGGDGAGGFNGTVGQINLNNFAGDQYFRVVPEPASLTLLSLVCLLRRRA